MRQIKTIAGIGVLSRAPLRGFFTWEGCLVYAQPYPNLFRPLKVRELTLKNRIMSAPNMLFRTASGKPDDYYIGYIEHKARGGAAIVNLGECPVCDGGCHTPGPVMDFEFLPEWSEVAAAIHEHNAIASVELTHAGQKAKPQYNKGGLYGPCETVNAYGARVRAMTIDDMEMVADSCAAAAEYWFLAGFDTVLLHFGHGWLFAQFLSPMTNKRTDEFGGSLENRMRFPLMTLKRVRERVGPNKAVMLRISGSERTPGGFDAVDMAEFVSRAQEYVDLVEVSVEGLPNFFANTFEPWGQNVDLAETIRKSGKVHIPVFALGSILAPDQAEEIIASGKADGVSMSRALIADPYLPLKSMCAKTDDIRPCIRCLTCTESDNLKRHFICSVNPLISRESRLGFGDDVGKAKFRKRVLIVGGGPAGMQAAITASERGHEVILCEKMDKLGGMLSFTDRDSLKHDLRRFKDYLVHQVGKSAVRVMLNTEATPELVERLKPDHVIVATGAVPIVPDIPGIERARHVTEIYFGPEDFGDDIVIIGGGLVGVEAGMHLKNIGKNVTVLEMQDTYAPETKMVYRAGLVRKLEKLGLEVITGARCVEVLGDGVKYLKGGGEYVAKGRTILYAVGMKPNEQPYFDLYDKAPVVQHIGDCLKPGKVDGAVHSGFFAALDIGVV